ncbi:MAG: hypothetical protein IJ963_04010 [Phascolarctobacterium sp.]|nr:hypothetical protein [Phascolarctobacterium sp.]MBR2140010.1 hypothetical protein [Phascolarctobacterium sp.]
MKNLNEKLENIIVPDYCDVFAGYNTGEYYASCVNADGIYEVAYIDEVDLANAIKRSNPSLDEDADADEVVEAFIQGWEDNADAKYVVSRMYEDSKIFYNLDNTNVAVVEPNKFSVIDMQDLFDEGFAFVKSEHMGSQVLPRSEKQIDLVDKVGELFGLSIEDTVLLSTWLVAAFVPHIVKPVLYVNSESVDTLAWVKFVVEHIVDPTNGKELYYNDKSEHDMLAKRYLHFGYNIKDLNWLLWHNLENEGLTGGDMGNMRNAMVTFDLTMRNFDVDLLAKVLTVSPKVELSNREELAEAIASFEEDRPYILQAIFTVLSEAMAVKDSIEVEYAGVLTDFMQWAAAISFVLFGSKDVFTNAYVERKPFGRDVNAWKANYLELIATKREKLLNAKIA